jgi:hypothetical protein
MEYSAVHEQHRFEYGDLLVTALLHRGPLAWRGCSSGP